MANRILINGSIVKTHSCLNIHERGMENVNLQTWPNVVAIIMKLYEVVITKWPDSVIMGNHYAACATY